MRLALVAFGAATVACGNGAGPPAPQSSTLQVLHAILNGPPLAVIVDSRSVTTGLTFGQITHGVTLASGAHTLEPRPPQDTTRRVLLVFNTTESVNYTAFVVDSVVVDTVIIDPVLVPDTGSQPAAGHGRLRLVNFATLAGPIDAYRTQPDSSGLLLTQRPFNYRAITRYFDGTAGRWTVVISHGGATDTLMVTDSIAVGDGQARTVAIIDSAGGRVSWRVVTDR